MTAFRAEYIFCYSSAFELVGRGAAVRRIFTSSHTPSSGFLSPTQVWFRLHAPPLILPYTPTKVLSSSSPPPLPMLRWTGGARAEVGHRESAGNPEWKAMAVEVVRPVSANTEGRSVTFAASSDAAMGGQSRGRKRSGRGREDNIDLAAMFPPPTPHRRRVLQRNSRAAPARTTPAAYPSTPQSPATSLLRMLKTCQAPKRKAKGTHIVPGMVSSATVLADSTPRPEQPFFIGEESQGLEVEEGDEGEDVDAAEGLDTHGESIFEVDVYPTELEEGDVPAGGMEGGGVGGSMGMELGAALPPGFAMGGVSGGHHAPFSGLEGLIGGAVDSDDGVPDW